MEQQKSSMLVPLLLVAVLAVGGYFFISRSVDEKGGNSEVVKTQEAAQPANTDQAAALPAATGDVDGAIDAILSGAAADDSITGGAADDSTFVTSDSAEVNSYGDAYDTTGI